MLIHSGEVVKRPRKKRVYPCSVCDKVYRQKRSLTYHIEQTHEGLGLPQVEVPGGEEEMEGMEQENDGLPQVEKVPGGEEEVEDMEGVTDTGAQGDKLMPQVEKVPNGARGSEVEKFNCSICYKGFRLKSSLSSHKSREHRGD